jgi:hypothetical protein
MATPYKPIYVNPNGKRILELMVDGGRLFCRDEDGWHEIKL